MFNKVVVANRGAVASRVLRALTEMGIRTVAVYSEADAGAPYLELSSEAHAIGPAPARESYLDQDRLLEVMRRSHADGLHPGYGFLSENAAFAQRVNDSGARFIGPSPRWIEAMGHKTRARELAARYGMPMARGSDVLPADGDAILAAARAIGYPVLVKPAGGGGGIGMLPAKDETQLLAAVERSRSMAARGFGTAEVYLERLMERPRHVEFQVLGDTQGGAAHLYERDCSVQRRNQKVIEEAPAPGLPRADAVAMAERVTGVIRDMGYDNIGTVEMLLGADGGFSFLEMNTRLQVEHGVTEEVTGVDLVKAQVRSAAGEKLADILPARVAVSGHAIQARVYAEDPKNFFPSPGRLKVFRPPAGAGIRVETGFAEGREVTPHYDPMIAKVIAHAPTRGEAIDRLAEALEAFAIEGLKHNIPAVVAVLRSEAFRAGRVHTGLIPEVSWAGKHERKDAKGKKGSGVDKMTGKTLPSASSRLCVERFEVNAQTLIAEARSQGRIALDERAGKQLLAEFGIAVPKSLVVRDAAAAASVLAALEPPFALKVMSPDILHKSDVGGVRVGLTSTEAIVEAMAEMMAVPQIARARVDGFLVEEMAPAGQEIVVGGVRDPQFGPLVMAGLGGVFVEVLADVAFRICPLTRLDAEEMLDELKGAALLKGARGRPPASRAAIVDVLLKVGGENGLLLRHAADIQEADINPLIVSRDAAVAVDARFLLTMG